MNKSASSQAVQKSRSGAFKAGMRASIPIMLGYIPIAIAYAGSAAATGMSFWQIVALSFFVYTGAGQMSTVSLLAQNAAMLSIVIFVFVLNLRHIIMSTVVMEDLKKTPLWKRCVLSFGVTDEVFAVFTTTKSERSSAAFFGGLVLGSWLSWWLGSALGAVLAGIFPDVLIASFSIAMPAMFLALLTPSVHAHVRLLIPVVSTALLSWGLSYCMESCWAMVIAALAGALIGLPFVKEEDV